MPIARVKIIDDKVCLSTAETAKTLGVDSDTLLYWGKKGCPKAARGYWPIADVLRWRGMVGAAGPRSQDEVEERSLAQQKLEAEIRYKSLQAEMQEIKNQISKGEYLPRDEVVNELSRYFVMLKRSLTGISRKLSTEVAPFVDPLTARRIERYLTEIINEALEQMSIEGVYEPTTAKKKEKKKSS